MPSLAVVSASEFAVVELHSRARGNGVLVSKLDILNAVDAGSITRSFVDLRRRAAVHGEPKLLVRRLQLGFADNRIGSCRSNRPNPKQTLLWGRNRRFRNGTRSSRP